MVPEMNTFGYCGLGMWDHMPHWYGAHTHTPLVSGMGEETLLSSESNKEVEGGELTWMRPLYCLVP